MIENMTNLYPLRKTLRFKLLPVGATLQNFQQKKLLNEDQDRAGAAKLAKKVMDENHKRMIERVLSTGNVLSSVDLKAYASLYNSLKRSSADKTEMRNYEAKMRKVISNALKKDKMYALLWKKDVIRLILDEMTLSEDETRAVQSFERFFTYFSGYQNNRENLYSDEEKSTAVAYRCINENLPKFLDNMKVSNLVMDTLDSKDVIQLERDFNSPNGIKVRDHFELDFFNFVLSEGGIEEYNNLIGGYSLSDGTKVKGINEYINLYNQISDGKRLPLLKKLYKQILSDKEEISYVSARFENDEEVVDALHGFFSTKQEQSFFDALEGNNGIVSLFRDIQFYDWNQIFVSGSQVSSISIILTGSWCQFVDRWNELYDEKNNKKRSEAYYKTREKTFKSVESFSLKEITETLNLSEKEVCNCFNDYISKIHKDITEQFESVEEIISTTKKQDVFENESSVEKVKELLDTVKQLEHFLIIFQGTGKEETKDELFYGLYLICLAAINPIDELYDRIRNYVTRKPFRTEKIKLNFNNPQFLYGWQHGKERDCSGSIFLSKGKYYLAICDPNHRSVYEEITSDDNGDCQQMLYSQMANPSTDIPNLMVINGKTEKKNGRRDPITNENTILENLKNQYLPEEINKIRKKRSFSTASSEFSKEDLSIYIAYYADRVKEYYGKNYDFHFKNPDEYASFVDFTNHVDAQAYQIRFRNVSMSELLKFVSEGKLYLFEIYCKDFSEFSRGVKNLHTMYFEMLFDCENLNNPVYKLSGNGEVFFRPASIKPEKQIIHKAGDILENKNPDNKNKTSIFSYDLIKDKRYTKDQFELHLSIELNFTSKDYCNVNDLVRNELKQKKKQYFIGIDRGERHLLYLCVVDNEGRIVEQESLNSIVSKYNETEHKVNYHGLLDKREGERNKSRKEWKTIETIKELKEGYLSQVVRKICDLVIKYDAIIVLEDLNSGFKRSRVKVEKQVYQKFEKQLIEKLNFLVASKTIAPDSRGGLLHAYQLTAPFESFSKLGKQTGIIFYVPAWLTSKIDPVTGFADLFPKMTTEQIRKCILTFDGISYDSEEKMFMFSFNYANIPGCRNPISRPWNVFSYGTRIAVEKDEQNNKYTSREVELTDAYIKLFDVSGIEWRKGDLRAEIASQNTAFVGRFWKLFKLTIQLRNSIPNTECDYLISPVKRNGIFYNSEHASDDLPKNADANGAYNIARKGIWVFRQICECEDLKRVKLAMTNKEWLEMVQENE